MATIRPLTPQDLPAIARLVDEAGFPARSEAGWRWAMFGNPEQGDIPAGLGAERNGRLVAMVGLQARDFCVRGTRLKAVSGHTFIASREGRGAGFALAREALKTRGVAAIYSLNSNGIAGRFYSRIGLTPWLGRAGRQRMEWPVRTLSVVTGTILSRLARSEQAYRRLSARERFAGAATRLDTLTAKDPDVQRLLPRNPDQAEAIDGFSRVLEKMHPAVPVRRASVYAYQMADPDAAGRTGLYGLYTEGELEGLMQLVLTKPNAFEPAALDIVDLETRPGADACRVVPRLVNEAKSIGRRAGVARLRLPFSDRFEPCCFAGTGARFVRSHGHDVAQSWFADGMEPFARHWMPTGFESDYFFALRMLPPATANAQLKAGRAVSDTIFR